MPPVDPSILQKTATIPVNARAWWWRPIENLAMLGGILYWGIVGLLITALSLPLGLLLPRRKAQIVGRSVIHLTFRTFVHYLRLTGLVQADLRSLEPLRHSNEPIIIAPNHHSLWDAVFVIAALPQPLCIMKQSIMHNPFLGGGARLAGYISNASAPRLIRNSSAALNEGGQLLLFPEGTRTRHDARWINSLKGGCALISQRSKTPIHPVFIRSNSRFLEKGWPLWRRPEFPIRISIELGTPVHPRPKENAHQLTDRLAQIYERNLSRAHKLRRQVLGN